MTAELVTNVVFSFENAQLLFCLLCFSGLDYLMIVARVFFLRNSSRTTEHICAAYPSQIT